MHKIELTQEELIAGLPQISGRIDALRNIQIEAGKDGDIKQVLELEETIKAIKSLYSKLLDCLFR